jgi:hypothetical protein
VCVDYGLLVIVGLRIGLNDLVGDGLTNVLGDPAKALHILPVAVGGGPITESVAVPVDCINLLRDGLGLHIRVWLSIVYTAKTVPILHQKEKKVKINYFKNL